MSLQAANRRDDFATGTALGSQEIASAWFPYFNFTNRRDPDGSRRPH